MYLLDCSVITSIVASRPVCFSEAMLHHATLFLPRLSLTRTCWEFPWLGSSPQLFERSARDRKMQGNPLILQQEWRLQNSSKRNRHNSTRTIPQCKIMERERHARVHTHLYCKPKRAQVQTPKTPMCQKCLRAMTCHNFCCWDQVMEFVKLFDPTRFARVTMTKSPQDYAKAESSHFPSSSCDVTCHVCLPTANIRKSNMAMGNPL
jgi:hypothetical protein